MQRVPGYSPEVVERVPGDADEARLARVLDLLQRGQRLVDDDVQTRRELHVVNLSTTLR